MITIENVFKAFDSHVVIDEFNYVFENGKSYALIGPSGSGKTTLLNMIGKLEKIDKGRILINDRDLTTIREKDYFKNYVGYLFQNHGLIDNESIKVNLELAFVGQRIAKNERENIMKAALRKVNLAVDLNRKIYSLSGGESQRVAIAKLIIKNPPIILADEPTASLDQDNGDEITELILNLMDEQKVIIIATHNPLVQEKLDYAINIKGGISHEN